MIAGDVAKGVPLLAALAPEELAELLTLLHERRVAKGGYIITASEAGSSLLFLLAGSAKVTLEGEDGKEVILSLLERGAFFGEITLLTGQPRTANVIATQDSLLAVLTSDDFFRHLRSHSGLLLGLARELAGRLAAASSKIGDLALLDVTRRLVRTLRSLARPHEEGGEESALIERRPTHQDLASMVGTSREMVTRALKALEEDGSIEIREKQILLRRLPA